MKIEILASGGRLIEFVPENNLEKQFLDKLLHAALTLRSGYTLVKDEEHIWRGHDREGVLRRVQNEEKGRILALARERTTSELIELLEEEQTPDGEGEK